MDDDLMKMCDFSKQILSLKMGKDGFNLGQKCLAVG
jgi:hypothetical protein